MILQTTKCNVELKKVKIKVTEGKNGLRERVAHVRGNYKLAKKRGAKRQACDGIGTYFFRSVQIHYVHSRDFATNNVRTRLYN